MSRDIESVMSDEDVEPGSIDDFVADQLPLYMMRKGNTISMRCNTGLALEVGLMLLGGTREVSPLPWDMSDIIAVQGNKPLKVLVLSHGTFPYNLLDNK